MRRAPWRLAAVGIVIAAACTQDVTAPGACPTFCPSAVLTVIDTVLAGAIIHDSAFGRPIGFVNPYNATSLLAANLPGVRDSRPIFRTARITTRMSISTTDTTTGAVTGVDSLYLRFTITRRDTATHNLRLSVFSLPITIDSTTALPDLAGSFAGTPVRTINIDTLVALPGRKNTVTGDSAVVDSINNRVTVLLSLDSSQAPFSLADSGQLAFGFRVDADAQPTIALGAFEAGLGPGITWFLKVDSLGVVAHRSQTPTTAFDSFVFTPAALPLDSTLAVGGVPSARSLLRVLFPRSLISDSSLLTRATLELIPALNPTGIAADSFGLVASAIVADFGAKTPLDLTHVDTTIIHVGVYDTVRVDITRILRYWAADTLAPTAIELFQVPEGADFAEIRFRPSADSTHRPRLRLTYSPHYPFGRP